MRMFSSHHSLVASLLDGRKWRVSPSAILERDREAEETLLLSFLLPASWQSSVDPFISNIMGLLMELWGIHRAMTRQEERGPFVMLMGSFWHGWQFVSALRHFLFPSFNLSRHWAAFSFVFVLGLKAIRLAVGNISQARHNLCSFQAFVVFSRGHHSTEGKKQILPEGRKTKNLKFKHFFRCLARAKQISF